jgi:DNA-binding transcriptional LysR family regulator
MRGLNLDQLRALVELIERGSFTAAARELNLTQPAVTHQVQELERRFKVTLVERSGKHVYLTQAGEKLIEHARCLLEEEARTQLMMRRFSDGWLGRVRVGTSMTILMYLLPPILRQLKTDYPQLEINLKAGLTATTLQLLKANALDLGLCAIPVADPAFETVPLFKDELVAILPAELEGVPDKVTPAFLSQCPLILGNEESTLRRMVTNWLALAGLPPKPLMEFDNVEAMKSIVAVGLVLRLSPAPLWVPDTFRRRTCLCGHSLPARAGQADWSGCGESGRLMGWSSSPRHCCPCGARDRAAPLPAPLTARITPPFHAEEPPGSPGNSNVSKASGSPTH